MSDKPKVSADFASAPELDLDAVEVEATEVAATPEKEAAPAKEEAKPEVKAEAPAKASEPEETQVSAKEETAVAVSDTEIGDLEDDGDEERPRLPVLRQDKSSGEFSLLDTELGEQIFVVAIHPTAWYQESREYHGTYDTPPRTFPSVKAARAAGFAYARTRGDVIPEETVEQVVGLTLAVDVTDHEEIADVNLMDLDGRHYTLANFYLRSSKLDFYRTLKLHHPTKLRGKFYNGIYRLSSSAMKRGKSEWQKLISKYQSPCPPEVSEALMSSAHEFIRKIVDEDSGE